VPLSLDSLTGVRLHGEDGIIPVDVDSAWVVHAGGEIWLCWRHNQIERAANFRHIVELIADAGWR
jgi:hypothetical protein